MKSQIKIGTIFGVELGLHYSWFVIALLITFSLVAQFHAVNRDWSDVLVWSTATLTGVLFFACLFRTSCRTLWWQKPGAFQYTKSPCSCSEV